MNRKKKTNGGCTWGCMPPPLGFPAPQKHPLSFLQLTPRDRRRTAPVSPWGFGTGLLGTELNPGCCADPTLPKEWHYEVRATGNQFCNYANLRCSANTARESLQPSRKGTSICTCSWTTTGWPDRKTLPCSPYDQICGSQCRTPPEGTPCAWTSIPPCLSDSYTWFQFEADSRTITGMVALIARNLWADRTE